MIYAETYVIEADDEVEARLLIDQPEVYPVTSQRWGHQYKVRISEVPAGFQIEPM